MSRSICALLVLILSLTIFQLATAATANSDSFKSLLSDRNCKRLYMQWKGEEGYGAVANGRTRCATSSGQSSLAEARAAALTNCRKRSRNCEIVAENSKPSLWLANWKNCKENQSESALESCAWLIKSGKAKGEQLAFIFNTRAIIREKDNRIDEALNDYSAAIDAHKTYPWAYSNRAYILEKKGLLDEALDDAETALRYFKPEKDCGKGCDIRESANQLIERTKGEVARYKNANKESLCEWALNHDKTLWEVNVSYIYAVKTAESRGLTISDCREVLGFDREPNSYERTYDKSLCDAALDLKRLGWNASNNAALREATRRHKSIGGCRVELGLPKEPVAEIIANSANDLLKSITEYSAEGQEIGNPIRLAKAVADLKTSLAAQVEGRVKNSIDSLNTVLNLDVGYKSFLASRDQRKSEKAALVLANARSEVQKFREFSIGYVRRNVAADATAKLLTLIEVLETIPPDAALAMLEQGLLYATVTIQRAGLEKELESAGIKPFELATPAFSGPEVGKQNRQALVVGNSAYQFGNVLLNPGNDARAISSVLRELGFNVIEGLDLGLVEIKSRIREFESNSQSADVALFYYAGHAIQVDGSNYLIPVDAKIESEDNLLDMTIELNGLVGQMVRGKQVGVVLIDACRDNPFRDKLAATLGGPLARTLGDGLAAPTLSNPSVLFGFATAPGQLASDGNGQHSPFTTALLKYLPSKSEHIEDVLFNVRKDVLETTKKQQNPWVTTGLPTRFWLNP